MKPGRSLSLGLERIGLLALRAPILALCLIALVAAAGVAGTARLQADDALDDLLRSASPEYLTFDRFRARFPTSELDIVAVAHLPAPVTADRLERLRDLHLDLAFAEGVANVFSMFTLHLPDPQSGQMLPLIPAELPQAGEFAPLLDELASHRLVAGRFYRRMEDGSALALLVAELDRSAVDDKGVTTMVAGVTAEVRRLAAVAGLQLEVTGTPVMKAEILASSIADARFFNIAGFAIGLAICWLFFRNVRLVALVLLPTLLSLGATLGLLGWLGLSLNPLTNTIIPLVMVMSFANGLHLVFAIRDYRQRGRELREAIQTAIETVGPACVLSAATTVVAFLSLTLTDSRLVSTYGLTAAAATGLSLGLVVFAVPTLALFLFPVAASDMPAQPQLRASLLDRGLSQLCLWLSQRIMARPSLIAAAGILAVLGASLLYLRLEPRYRLTDIIPDSRQSARAAQLVDREFGGLNPLQVMISWPGEFDVQAPEIRAAIGEVQQLFAGEPQLANARSILDVQWPGPQGRGFDRQWLDSLPLGLAQRNFSADRRAGVVTANAPDLEAKHLDALRRDLDRRLDAVREAHPSLRFELTGFAVLAASRAIHTIESLNLGMLAAMLIVLGLLGLLYGSVHMALIGFSVNLFAVVATGAWLYVSGTGLQYVSVVGLTVAFGIAVDDTVHFLNRFHLAMEQGRPWRVAVKQTLERTGPILILTTIVVVAGMATTLTSEVPPTRTFGMLSIATLLFALVGDVILLPAGLIAWHNLRLRVARRRPAPNR